VTAGDSQFSAESLEELTSAKSGDTVSVCVLSLCDGTIKYKRLLRHEYVRTK